MDLVTETRLAYLACASVAVELLGRPEVASTWSLGAVRDGLRVADVAAALGGCLAVMAADTPTTLVTTLHPTATTVAAEARAAFDRLDGRSAGSRPSADDPSGDPPLDGASGRPADDALAGSLADLALALEDLALSVAQHVDVSPSTARAALELLLASARRSRGGLASLDGFARSLRATEDAARV